MFSFRVPLRAKGSNRVLKKSFSCFDRLSTNGKSPTIATPAPFALSLSKGERRVFQQPARGWFPRWCVLKLRKDNRRPPRPSGRVSMPITELLGSAGLFWKLVLRFGHWPFLHTSRE